MENNSIYSGAKSGVVKNPSKLVPQATANKETVVNNTFNSLTAKKSELDELSVSFFTHSNKAFAPDRLELTSHLKLQSNPEPIFKALLEIYRLLRPMYDMEDGCYSVQQLYNTLLRYLENSDIGIICVYYRGMLAGVAVVNYEEINIRRNNPRVYICELVVPKALTTEHGYGLFMSKDMRGTILNMLLDVAYYNGRKSYISIERSAPWRVLISLYEHQERITFS